MAAQCPTHALPANATCGRCGNFVCPSCGLWPVCQPCAALADRDRLRVGRVEAVAALSVAWGGLTFVLGPQIFALGGWLLSLVFQFVGVVIAGAALILWSRTQRTTAAVLAATGLVANVLLMTLLLKKFLL